MIPMPRFLRTSIHLYVDAFRGLPREVWLLCGVFLINRAGTMVVPFLSLYAIDELHFTKGQTGGILAAFGLGSVLGSYFGGKLSDRLGAIRLQQWVLTLSGAAFLLLLVLRSYSGLAAGVFLVALISDAFRPAAMASVVELTPVARRTRALALVRLAVNLGMSLGPAVGGLLAEYDYRWLFVGDGVTCWLAALALFLFFRKRPRKLPVATSEEESGDSAVLPAVPRSAFRDLPFLALMGLVFLLSATFFQIIGALPIYLQEGYGLSEKRIGLLLGFNALLIVLVEMFLVRVLEHRNHLVTFGFGGLLTALGLGLLPHGSTWTFALFTVVVWTFGEMIALPFGNALVAQRAGEGSSGEYMGVYSATFALAMLTAPVAGLWIYDHWGAETLWTTVGAMGPLLLLGSLLLRPWYARR